VRLSCRSHFVEVKEQKQRKERRRIIIDIFVFSSCRLRQQLVIINRRQIMNAQNTSTNYMGTGHAQSTLHVTPTPSESESRIDKAYILSIRGILKYACLVSKYFFQYSCVF